MYGRTLSWGLHQGRQVQTQLARRAYADVGEEHQNGKINCGEISPGELRHSVTCSPIRMDISSTRHLVHRIHLRGSGGNDSGNLFASSFLQKDENPLPNSRNSKYNAGQESRTGTPEFSDISTVEVLKIPAGSVELVRYVTSGGSFSNADHLWTLSE